MELHLIFQIEITVFLYIILVIFSHIVGVKRPASAAHRPHQPCQSGEHRDWSVSSRAGHCLIQFGELFDFYSRILV